MREEDAARVDWTPRAPITDLVRRLRALAEELKLGATSAKFVRLVCSRTIPLLTEAADALSHPVPEGWRLVPVEPTREMLNAAIDVDSFKLGDISPLGFRCSPQQLFEQCYAAMLSAAPHPLTDEGREDEKGER